MSKRIYRTDLSSMHPLHPAWGLWLTDLFGLNVSLMFGRVLMTTRSWREYKVIGRWSSVMWHEAVHRKQKLEAGYLLFFLRYGFTRKWRARYEREAYEVTLAFLVYTHATPPGGGGGWASRLANSMADWRYLWMMGHQEATDWAFDLLTELTEAMARGELAFEDTRPFEAYSKDNQEKTRRMFRIDRGDDDG